MNVFVKQAEVSYWNKYIVGAPVSILPFLRLFTRRFFFVGDLQSTFVTTREFFKAIFCTRSVLKGIAVTKASIERQAYFF
jgi:hypothetical protein